MLKNDDYFFRSRNSKKRSEKMEKPEMFSTPRKKLQSPFLARIQADESCSFPSPGILTNKNKQTSTPFHKRSPKEVTFHIPDISVIKSETPQRKIIQKENKLPVPRGRDNYSHAFMYRFLSVNSPAKNKFSDMDSDAFHSCVEEFSDDQSEIKDSKGRIFHEITNDNERSFANDLNENLTKFETPNEEKPASKLAFEKSIYMTPSENVTLNLMKKEKPLYYTPAEKLKDSRVGSATKYYTPSYIPHSPAPRSGKLEDVTNRLSNLLDNIRYDSLYKKLLLSLF